jgi:NO-binding membrane sensor protein with MHYT domain
VAEVNQFAYGWVYPILADGVSVSSILLGLIVATKAKGRVGRTRVRLLGYGAVAVGGVGVWLTQLVTTLVGLHVSNVVMRYDPARLAISLGCAVFAVAAGLVLLCCRTLRGVGVLTATGLLTAGILAGSFGGLWSLRFSGTADFEFGHAMAALATATIAAGTLVWFLLGRRRGLQSAAVSATVVAAALAGTHYLATAGMQVVPSLDLPRVPGLGAAMLLPPVVLLGSLITAMLWYFTVGAATRDDLRALFVNPQDSIEIEPWVIADIRARIAAGAAMPDADTIAQAPRPAARRQPREARPGPAKRPTGRGSLPTVAAAWRGMPVWGVDATPDTGRPSVGRIRVDVRWLAADRPTPPPLTPTPRR